jgi:hypothetical protein
VAVRELCAQGTVPEVTGLLRACLEYRFGADVAVGDGPAQVTGTDVRIG